MKRLSVCLLLLTSCAGAFAACSSSDDSSSSGGGASAAGHAGANGGAGGRAGASSGGHGGTHAGNGAAGEAGESAGGEPNGAAGSDESAAGASNDGGAHDGGGSGGRSAGGNAGHAGSGGSSGGSANGGSAGSVSAGSGGISGQGANTGSTSKCGASAQTAYADGIVAYFNAQVAKSGCMPPQTHGMDASETQECAASTCGASAGCSASFTWHDVSYDAATGTFSAQVDIASTLAVTGAATCSLSDQVTGRTVNTSLILVDNDTSLGTSINLIHAGGGTASASGCDTLVNAADIASSDMDFLTTTAEDAALSTLLTYSVDCTP